MYVLWIKHGSMVNICALDLSKAFDKMNRRGYLKSYYVSWKPGLLSVLLVSSGIRVFRVPCVCHAGSGRVEYYTFLLFILIVCLHE